MFRKALKTLGLILLAGMVAFTAAACVLKKSASQSNATPQQAVPKELTERASKALDSINKIVDAKLRNPLLEDYKKLDNALLSRNTEDVKKYLNEIEPKIVSANASAQSSTGSQAGSAPTADQVAKKGAEIKSAAGTLTDANLKKTLTDKYTTAENAYKAGDMKKAWDILMEIEGQLKK